ncbi:hypothetical protein T10_12701 [Trichinella papuae]|uniref:Uncharacterized protein n=1 Tax=Trichinella papuae TaxID=268474 RepID=A0A0V1N9I9_9BILA|nr:hypothetical protein T10_12701 [Trichinella papuae]
MEKEERSHAKEAEQNTPTRGEQFYHPLTMDRPQNSGLQKPAYPRRRIACSFMPVFLSGLRTVTRFDEPVQIFSPSRALQNATKPAQNAQGRFHKPFGESSKRASYALLLPNYVTGTRKNIYGKKQQALHE